jgi:predicted metal-dependent HD superfamily phosphohydrolase
MSILGSLNKVYKQYATNIRKEYRWVPSKQYVTARVEILRAFLSRERLFFTDVARDEFENQARANIFNELNGLQG